MSRAVGIVVAVAAALWFAANAAYSFPRLSIEHAEPCQNCHISPAGGGARTEYGNSTTALNELSLPQTKKLLVDQYRKPRIGDALIVGFDARWLVLDDLRVFRMQTDGFVTVTPFKSFLFHMRVNQTGVAESYGMLSLADSKYSMRIGTFAPAWGLHPDDHQAFVRASTGNGPELYLDGVSASAEVLGQQVLMEVFNPNQQAIYNFNTYRVGTFGPLGYLGGLAVRVTQPLDGDNYGSFPHAKALFGGMSWNRFTLSGEADLVGATNDGLIFYGSAVTRLEYGLYLIGEYNFYDFDRHLKTGTDEFMRFSLQFYPMPFVQLQPSYSYYLDGPRKNTDELFLQLHVGY